MDFVRTAGQSEAELIRWGRHWRGESIVNPKSTVKSKRRKAQKSRAIPLQGLDVVLTARATETRGAPAPRDRGYNFSDISELDSFINLLPERDKNILERRYILKHDVDRRDLFRAKKKVTHRPW
jgi:hypothetical protein